MDGRRQMNARTGTRKESRMDMQIQICFSFFIGFGIIQVAIICLCLDSSVKQMNLCSIRLTMLFCKGQPIRVDLFMCS